MLDKIIMDAISPYKWMRLAISCLGVAEIPGTKHNPLIIRWWQKIKAPFREDETPWCAAFVGGILEESGLTSTRSAAARSYEKWGNELDGPCAGAVVVLWRGSPFSASGHVGFVVGKDASGKIAILGGNQDNKVSIKSFALERVLSYHWPTAHDVPDKIGMAFLPIINTSGVSSNEA